MIGHDLTDCIVGRNERAGINGGFLRIFQAGLWPSQIDEIIDLMPASNGFMRMNIVALLDPFFCAHQMIRLANGVHFTNCSGR